MARELLVSPPMRVPAVDRRYEIVRLLGRGGSAAVYEAVDRLAGRRVALKVLEDYAQDPVAVRRLEREGRAALAIAHENVCETLGLGVLDDGSPFVAMELLEGESLREILRRDERLPAHEVFDLGLQLLAGLDAAHQHGVLHRDIKPENVFVVRRHGRRIVKLVDFGICRSELSREEELSLTTAGAVVGTPGYLAPEQVFGHGKVDHRADLFAVGLVLFELLAGRPAILGRDPLELAAALSEPVPALANFVSVTPTLARVVARATEHHPDDRYPTASMFLADLREARARFEDKVTISHSDMWDVPTQKAITTMKRQVA